MDGSEVDFIIEENVEMGRSIEVKFSKSEAKSNKYNILKKAYPDYPLTFWTWGNLKLIR